MVGGFIEQQARRVLHDGTGDEGPLPLTSRQLGDDAVFEPAQTDPVEGAAHLVPVVRIAVGQ